VGRVLFRRKSGGRLKNELVRPVDLVLGVLALIAWRPAVVAGLMCVSLLVYTVFIGVVFPSLWFEPFGGLLKNWPLIPAVLVMGVLAGRR
jgi:hypothetical protein